MWDERYSQPGFAYGTEPNEFLASAAGRIPHGPVLSLGEREGRNAAFLAGLGHRVVAVDQSEVGLAKAKKLSAHRGRSIETVCADLAAFSIEPGAWAGVVSIFCHLPRRIRRPLYAATVQGLRPGGVLVLEAYTPEQLGRGTGGPKTRTCCRRWRRHAKPTRLWSRSPKPGTASSRRRPARALGKCGRSG
jgi:SAM-dependent methyltransferase